MSTANIADIQDYAARLGLSTIDPTRQRLPKLNEVHGTYELKIVNTKLLKTYEHGDAYIVEFDIINASNGRKGRISHYLGLGVTEKDKGYRSKDLSAMLYGFGVPPEKMAEVWYKSCFDTKGERDVLDPKGEPTGQKEIYVVEEAATYFASDNVRVTAVVKPQAKNPKYTEILWLPVAEQSETA